METGASNSHSVDTSSLTGTLTNFGTITNHSGTLENKGTLTNDTAGTINYRRW